MSIADTDQYKGKWLYRSLKNLKTPDTPFNDLRWGQGMIDFVNIGYDHIYDSTLDMGGGYALNITGDWARNDSGAIFSAEWRGVGVEGTVTEGWIYDYRAFLSPVWDEATDKTIILVGSVLRTVEHGPSAPAGVTGSFYMVKLDEK